MQCLRSLASQKLGFRQFKKKKLICLEPTRKWRIGTLEAKNVCICYSEMEKRFFFYEWEEQCLVKENTIGTIET